MIKRLCTDKRGNGILIYALGIVVAALMFTWYQTAFSQLLIERAKLLKTADEAVLKASWEIYEYQSSTLSQTGTIDPQALQKGVAKVVDYFSKNGYTVKNTNLSVQRGYLVLDTEVDLYYKKPSLLNPVAQIEKVTIPIESKTTLKKFK